MISINFRAPGYEAEHFIVSKSAKIKTIQQSVCRQVKLFVANIKYNLSFQRVTVKSTLRYLFLLLSIPPLSFQLIKVSMFL